MSLTTIDPSTHRAAPTRKVSAPWAFWLSAAVLVAVFAYLLIYHYHHERQDHEQHLGDFPTFYEAAQFALQHRDIYTAGKPRQKYVYPPLMAFLYTPLTRLPRLQAAHVSLVFYAGVLLLSLLIAARTVVDRAGARGSVMVIVVAALVSLLNINEMRNELTMLETDALMLLTFTLALYWLDSRPAWAGIALAFAFNIKYLTIVLLPYLILRRRWKAVAAMGLGSVFFALLPALLLGWHEDLRCLHVAFGGLLKWFYAAPTEGFTVEVHNIGDTLSLSITTAVARSLGSHGFSNLAIMAVAGGIGVLALAIVMTMYRLHGFSLWKSPSPDARTAEPFAGLAALEWAGLVTVALAFSPDTNTRHLLLAVIVNTLGVVLLLMPRHPAANGLSTSRSSAPNPLPALAGIIIILISLTMPITALRAKYFRFGIPCWGLLAGYLLILWTGLRTVKNAECRVKNEE